MSELKACPFCGSDKIEVRHIKERWSVGCATSDCPCQWWHMRQYGDKDEAICAWNRRADGWISVKDRLPDVFDVVYVSVETWNGFHEPCTYETLGTVASDGDLCLLYGKLADGERIIHWQPLPEPPKEEEHE